MNLGLRNQVMIATALVLIIATRGDALAGPLPALRLSDNQRFLVTADGQPFFWLGDTAWELFHRLNREDAVSHLDHSARQSFSPWRRLSRWPSSMGSMRLMPADTDRCSTGIRRIPT